MDSFPFEPYISAFELDEKEMLQQSQIFLTKMQKRRTIRKFSSQPVDRAVIENCIRSAGTAPNGANKQPWFFAVVESPEKKKELRKRAEAEETEFYRRRASKEWLNDLRCFKTTANKPYLEIAPYLIAIFYKTFEWTEQKEKSRCYYPKESVGIATGLLITASHNCGLSTLTHTPSPMSFLNECLDVPKDQYKPFLLLVTGHPSPEAQVPSIEKKPLNQISKFF